MVKKSRVVKAPDSIEVVRLRKGTFIGDTENPMHLAHEAVDNFLDEIRNGYAKSAELWFNKDGSVWVMDSGRGLPLGETYVEESGKNHDTIELLFSKLHTGTKFDLDDYDTLFGQNGIGLVAINALSDWIDITVKKDKDTLVHYRFEDAILVKKEEIKKTPDWSTIVGFKPSKKYFDEIKYDRTVFLQRLKLAGARLTKSNFKINGKDVPKLSFEELAREFLSLDKKIPLFRIDYEGKMEVKREKDTITKPGKISVFLTYSPGETTIIGDVNLRICGGTFLTSFQTLLKSVIPGKLSKKFAKVPDRYLLDGLKLYISLEIPEPMFDSQTKVRMVTPVKKQLIDPLEDKLAKIISNKYIIDTIEEILERKLTGNLTQANTNTGGVQRVSAGNKLKDCTDHPGETLYIVEGDSAASTMQQVRNKNNEACLPLRGKVINVEKQSFDKIANNKEIKDLLEAIGDKNDLRYEKIKILTDADSDGKHISALLTIIMYKYYEDVIKDGRLKVIIPPLYGGKKKDKYVALYDITEVDKYKKQGYEIRRFKGLGEMNSKEMEACLSSNIEYTVQLPTKKEIVDLLKIVNDSDEKRRIMNLKEYDFDAFMNLILKKEKKAV